MGRFINNENSIFQKWAKKLVNEGGDVKEITPTTPSQSNYTFSSARVTSYYRCGKLVELSLSVDVATAYTSSPGIAVLDGLPIPKDNKSLFSVATATFLYNAIPIRCCVSSGKLYLRFGEAGKSYDIHIVYLANN